MGDPIMIPQIPLLSEREMAQSTLERLLIRMNKRVSLQFILDPEGPAARIASERFLAGVSAHVQEERNAGAERLRTVRAWEGEDVGV